MSCPCVLLRQNGDRSVQGWAGRSVAEHRHVADSAQVRDSKDRKGPVLSFASDQWAGFIQESRTAVLTP
ncbi:DUF397 domain-containing protein [Micromonospora rubida]|uniref:DUF397 domain-containing protein n=1 Tax=Micromonospora rubida TaxID=2697657 RepID=UPI0038B257E3